MNATQIERMNSGTAEAIRWVLFQANASALVAGLSAEIDDGPLDTSTAADNLVDELRHTWIRYVASGEEPIARLRELAALDVEDLAYVRAYTEAADALAKEIAGRTAATLPEELPGPVASAQTAADELGKLRQRLAGDLFGEAGAKVFASAAQARAALVVT